MRGRPALTVFRVFACLRALVAAGLLSLLGAAPKVDAGAYVESPTLTSIALTSTQGGARRILLQNLTGDAGLDLLVIRPSGDQFGFSVWERRDAVNGDRFVQSSELAGLGTADVQGLYVPGGVPGASRDLAVLFTAQVSGIAGTGNLQIYRNAGPGTRPRFSGAAAALHLPDARRLHYFPSFPIPPGQAGYIAYPLIASTGDDRLWVVVIGDDGSVIRQTKAVRHLGGAEDVLVFREPLVQKPAFISLGASPALLWRQASDGSYASQPLVLPGLSGADRVVQGVLAEFHNDGLPDLVLALADGRVLRWDGTGPVGPGQPMSFGAVQPVASGLFVHDLVELGVPYTDTQQLPTRRSGVMIAATPESYFYDTDITQAGRPFVAEPRRYAAAFAAAGDFGLDVAYLGHARGVSVLEYSEAAAPVPNPVGWADTDPLPVFRDTQSASRGAFIVLTSDAPRDRAEDVELSVRIRGAQGCLSTFTSLQTLPAGDRSYAKTAGVIFPSSAFDGEFDLCLLASELGTVIREPSTRPGYFVAAGCGEACTITCLNNARPPAAKGKASKALVDALGLTTLTRFRDEVLADSSKGRDYAAIYREYSNDIYRAVATTPYALRDIERARDAWLPAITAWVNGDRTTVITQPMLDTLDVLAQHLITLGSARLAATVQDQYQRLDPPSLLGQTIGDLETRFEQSVPTRGILRSSFEAGEPGN